MIMEPKEIEQFLRESSLDDLEKRSVPYFVNKILITSQTTKEVIKKQFQEFLETGYIKKSKEAISLIHLTLEHHAPNDKIEEFIQHILDNGLVNEILEEARKESIKERPRVNPPKNLYQPLVILLIVVYFSVFGLLFLFKIVENINQFIIIFSIFNFLWIIFLIFYINIIRKNNHLRRKIARYYQEKLI